MNDDEIHEIITTQVTMIVRQAMSEMFGFVKIVMIELFEERYATVSEPVVVVDATRFHGRGMMRYRDFSYMKSPEFDGVKDLIVSIRGYFMWRVVSLHARAHKTRRSSSP